MQQYNPLAVWDASFGITCIEGGNTVAAWADQTGNGYHWEQPGLEALQPILGNDGTPYLKFSTNQWMKCDSLAPLVSGLSHPWWMIAAIDNVPRNSTSRRLLCFGNNAATKLISTAPNLNATISRAYRIDDDAGTNATLVTTTGITEGIIIHKDDGYDQYLKWGAASGSAASGGNLITQYATLGADRYGIVPTVAAYFDGYVRGMSIGNNILTSDQINSIYTYWKNWAGY